MTETQNETTTTFDATAPDPYGPFETLGDMRATDGEVIKYIHTMLGGVKSKEEVHHNIAIIKENCKDADEEVVKRELENALRIRQDVVEKCKSFKETFDPLSHSKEEFDDQVVELMKSF